MDFNTFEIKGFKSLFYMVLGINIFVTLAAYLLGVNGMSIFSHQGAIAQTRVLLLTLLAAAVAQTIYQKRLLKQLDEFQNLEEKTAHYTKIYKLRIYWKCLSCLASCIIHLMTGRNIFLYFAVFDVLTTWTYFPNKKLISKELKTDDIVFIEN